MLRPGERVAGFDVQGVLGTGGMGAVYAAVGPSGERVALKLPRDPSPALCARMRREGRVLAGIVHPNVVHLHQVVEHRGVPVLVLERLDGPDLGELLRLISLEAQQGLDLFEGVLAGVAAVHAAGILHRDLKPANVLLDTGQGSPPRPKVSDFGLARGASDQHATRMTATGKVIGTLRYMAPERFTAPDRLDARADIWALGLILHHLVAGIPAFTAGGRGVRVDLRALRPDLPEALCQAIDGCLEPDPARRTPSCAALRSQLAPLDLRGLGPASGCHPADPPQQDSTWGGDQVWWNTSVEAPAVRRTLRGLVIAGELAPTEALRVVEDLAQRLATVQPVDHRSDDSPQLRVDPDGVLLDRGGVVTVVELTDTATSVDPDVSAGEPSAYLAPETRQRRDGDPRSAVFSLGMVAIFACLRRDPVWGAIQTPQDLVATLRLPDPVRHVLARAVDLDPTRRFPTPGTLADALRQARSDPPSAWRQPYIGPAFLRQRLARRRRLAGRVAIGLFLFTAVSAAAWALHANQAALHAAVRARAESWRASAEAVAATAPGDALALLRAAKLVHPDEGLGEARAWDLAAAGARVHVIPTGDPVLSVAASPTGELAATGLVDGTVATWSLVDGRRVARFPAGSGRPYNLERSPDGWQLLPDPRRAADGQATDAIPIVDLRSGKPAAVVHASCPVHLPRWSPRGDRLFNLCGDLDVLEVFDPSDAARLARVPVTAMGNRWLVLTSPAPQTLDRRVADGLAVSRQPIDGLPGLTLWHAARDPKGVVTLAAGPSAVLADSGARLWSLDPATGAVLDRAETTSGRDTGVLVSGDRALTWSRGAELWALDEHGEIEPVGRLDPPDRRIEAAALGPAGGSAVTGGTDGLVHVWDARTAASLQSLAGHDDVVFAVAGLPDGAVLSGSRDGTLRHWLAWPSGRPLVPGVLDVGGVSPSRDRVAIRTAEGSALYDLDGRRQSPLLPEAAAVAPLAEGGLAWLDAAGAVHLGVDGPAQPPPPSATTEAPTLQAAGSGRVLWRQRRLGVLLDAASGARMARFSIEGGGRFTAAASSRDGALAVFGTSAGGLQLWQDGGGPPSQLAELEGDAIASLSFSFDGRWLWVGTWSGALARIAISSGAVSTLDQRADAVLGIAWSDAGDRVASWSRDGALRLWRADGTAIGQPRVLAPGLGQAAWQANGARLAVTDAAGRIWVIDADPDRPPRVVGTVRGSPALLRWRDDRLLVLADDGRLTVLDATAAPRPLLQRTGGWTNLRVCRDTGQVVPVVPFPSADTVFAPPDACTAGLAVSD